MFSTSPDQSTAAHCVTPVSPNVQWVSCLYSRLSSCGCTISRWTMRENVLEEWGLHLASVQCSWDLSCSWTLPVTTMKLTVARTGFITSHVTWTQSTWACWFHLLDASALNCFAAAIWVVIIAAGLLGKNVPKQFSRLAEQDSIQSAGLKKHSNCHGMMP